MTFSDPTVLKVRGHYAPRAFAALLTIGLVWVALLKAMPIAFLFAGVCALAFLSGLRPYATFDGRTLTFNTMVRPSRTHTLAAGERFSTDGRAMYVIHADGTRRTLHDRDHRKEKRDAPRSEDWELLCRAIATGRVDAQGPFPT